jgi:molybdopterin synthase catalytic subunit
VIIATLESLQIHLTPSLSWIESAVQKPELSSCLLVSYISFVYWDCADLLGTTRDNFGGRAVKELQYQSYAPKAMQSMLEICTAVAKKWSLTSIAMVHRTGVVPIGEESILIAVSSPHRKEAFEAAEEALEECKLKVEIWKKEMFVEGTGVWKANDENKPLSKPIPSQHRMLGMPTGLATAPNKEELEVTTGVLSARKTNELTISEAPVAVTPLLIDNTFYPQSMRGCTQGI